VRRLLTGPAAGRFLRFFGASAAGLAIDLLGFQLLLLGSLEPWLANGISSFTSITVVYLLATRYSFGARTSPWTYIAFVAWYSASIVVFSAAIHLLAEATGAYPLLWKLASVPVSFVLNYTFSTVLFGRSRRRDPREGQDGEVGRTDD